MNVIITFFFIKWFKPIPEFSLCKIIANMGLLIGVNKNMPTTTAKIRSTKPECLSCRRFSYSCHSIAIFIN